MKRLTDTAPEAQRVFDEIYRNMPAWRKWNLLDEMFRFGRDLHASGVKHRRPQATAIEIRDDWVVAHWGEIPRRRLTEADLVEQPTEMQTVVREVTRAFKAAGIDYALGGSLASSIHGINRNTADADISVEPFPGKEAQVVASFGPDYYVSLDAVRNAVRSRSTFNVINTVAGFKVDVFVRRDRPFDVSVMRRRIPIVWPHESDESIDVVTPEDIILLKLEWYRLGNETSGQQWTDVQNVIRVRGQELDRGYLVHWAAEIGVSDLLERALSESQSG